MDALKLGFLIFLICFLLHYPSLITRIVDFSSQLGLTQIFFLSFSLLIFFFNFTVQHLDALKLGFIFCFWICFILGYPSLMNQVTSSVNQPGLTVVDLVYCHLDIKKLSSNILLFQCFFFYKKDVLLNFYFNQIIFLLIIQVDFRFVNSTRLH